MTDDNSNDAQRDGQQSRVFEVLDSLSVPELNQLVKRAEALISEKLESARQDFLSRMQAEGKELGIDLGSVLPQQAPAKRGRKTTSQKKNGRETTGRQTVAAKYRGPNGEEWSGRGRMPKWVQVAEAEGKSRDDFLINR